MNMGPFDVFWLCVFTLKFYNLIDLTWWIVAPMAICAAFNMWADRK